VKQPDAVGQAAHYPDGPALAVELSDRFGPLLFIHDGVYPVSYQCCRSLRIISRVL